MTRLIDANKLILWLNDVWYSSFKYEESPTSIAVKEAMKYIVEYVNTHTDAEPSGDLISRADAIEAVCKDNCGGCRPNECNVLDVCTCVQSLKALPSVSAEPISQTDSLIIADALRYLAEDEERHELDRAKAKELREKVLEYGASLSAEPMRSRCEVDAKSDLISRADAVEAVCGGCSIETKNNCKEEGDCYEVQNLKALPSAEPKRGEWEMCEDTDGEYGVCSVCGNDADFSHYGKPYRYCPNCGAYMGVSE